MRFLLYCSIVFCSIQSWSLTVYTDRSEAYLKSSIDQYELTTGDKVTLVSEKFALLMHRLRTEGKQSPSDLVIVKDLVYLQQLVDANMLMGAKLPNTVAKYMQHPKGYWTAISKRARTVVFNPSTVKRGEVQSYADLAKPKYLGKVCLRTSKASYNEAWVAFLIATNGAAKAEKILDGILNNLAIAELKSDRQLLKAIVNGECEVGIVNSYYLAGALVNDSGYPVNIEFVESRSNGVHINGTGAGVLKTTNQKSASEGFLAILLEEKNQLKMSGIHLDYPARTGLAPNTIVGKWGTFKESQLSWATIGENVTAAKKLIKKLGYN